MPLIVLEKYIEAPVEVCFHLSRSIDLHQVSTAKTNEKAIAGRTSGLIEEGEFVTWEAKHFGIKQKLTVKITKMDAPRYFRDEMLKGAFKCMWHEHIFKESGTGTLMTDKFYFEAPLGILGKLATALVLKGYMTRFIEERNDVIKQTAENGEWKKVLKM